MAGVNYLDKNLAQHLDDPTDLIFDNDNASAVGHVFQAFAEQGTTSWQRRTVEWFLVSGEVNVFCTGRGVNLWPGLPDYRSRGDTA